QGTLQRVLAIANPFEIKTGDSQVGVIGGFFLIQATFEPAFIEAEGIATREDREVTVASIGGFEGLIELPGLAFVLAEFDGEIASVTWFALDGFAIQAFQ